MQNMHKYEILIILINAHSFNFSIMLNKSILMAAIDIKCYTDILHASFILLLTHLLISQSSAKNSVPENPTY